MKQVNVIDFMPDIHDQFPDLDPKALNAMVHFFFRQLYVELKHHNDIHLQNTNSGLNVRLYGHQRSPKTAKRVTWRKRIKKLKLRELRDSLDVAKPGEKFKLKRKRTDEKPENP